MKHYPPAVLSLLVVGTMLLATGSPEIPEQAETELLVAIRNGDHSEVQELLRAGADVNTADSEGTTALMHALIESDVRMLRLLIDSGANVNATNEFDSTPLMYAATELAKTRLLLARGADVDAMNQRGATAMNVAVKTFGSTPVLKLLAARGAESHEAMMASAAQKGDLEAMQFLFGIGVSPGGSDSAPLFAALGARCEACVRLLLEKGGAATGIRRGRQGLLSETAKRAMPEMSQLLRAHGAPLDVEDREGFTPLMQAVLSFESPESRDGMVQWLLAEGVDPNTTNDRGETAYQLAARMGASAALELLKSAGATEVTDAPWPQPVGSPSARAGVERILPQIETSGQAVYNNRGCVSCHNNSLPAMTVALARKKGFLVNEDQAEKELGFAVATERPYLESMRLGSSIGGAAVTLSYTLMGMAAAGYEADALTDAHVHFLALHQYPDGSWKHTTSYRPPLEYSPVATTALVLGAMRLYPIPGRREEFEMQFDQAKQWLLAAEAYSGEEQSMQLSGLAAAGATADEIAPFVEALKTAQNQDGSWSQLPVIAGDAYATGEALYALHVSGNVPTTDPAYQQGVQWLLGNQLADGSWFVPARTIPIQPYFESGFPHGTHQWISDAGSSWASMALLFTLPDRP